MSILFNWYPDKKSLDNGGRYRLCGLISRFPNKHGNNISARKQGAWGETAPTNHPCKPQ